MPPSAPLPPAARAHAAALFALLLATAAALLLPACSASDPADTVPPLFAPGEYGGDPLPGTEHIFNVTFSPGGQRVAFVRQRTPDEPLDPLYQLWVTDRDGSNPRLMGTRVLTVNWSPDGKTLAVTVALGIDFYVYTLDVATGEATQWTGLPHQTLSFPVASSGSWFRDGERMLAYVTQEAFQQPFPRGLYIIDTSDSTTTRYPLIEFFNGGFLGNHDEYAVGRKYLPDQGPLDGNYALVDVSSRRWTWLTEVPKDSLRLIRLPMPNPTGPSFVQPRVVENAEQLFLFEDASRVRAGVSAAQQITRVGGDNPVWTYDGRRILFRRDVDPRPGARYVPFVYDVMTGTQAPVWPAQPDSVPVFPPVASQTYFQP